LQISIPSERGNDLEDSHWKCLPFIECNLIPAEFKMFDFQLDFKIHGCQRKWEIAEKSVIGLYYLFSAQLSLHCRKFKKI